MELLDSFFKTIQFFVIILIFVLFSGSGLAVFVYGFILWWRWRNREEESLKFVLYEIAVPKDNEVKIDAMEQMITSFYSLYRGGKFKFLKHQPHISFELVGKPNDIRFYISCPNEFKEVIERQIHAAYPGSEVKEVEEYNIFTESGKVAYQWLVLKKEFMYPIKTYRELPTDSLAAITSALAKTQENEGAAIQILVSPADSEWQSSGKNYVSSIKKQEADPEKAKFKIEAKTLEAIETKSSKPGFITVVRIVACATTMEIAKNHLDNIKAALSQLNSPWNSLTGKKIRLPYSFMTDFIYRYQPVFWNNKTILNSEELATLFHFPNKTIETPNIHWLTAKSAAAPSGLPEAGLYLGKSDFRGVTRPVYIQENDRRRHIYIIGKTGTGKSELLREMILQDIKAGKGVCFIDPHDTVEKILGYLPPERIDDVIYFDPSTLERPMGLNLLEAENEDQKHFVATSIINLMYKLYDPYKTGIVGPRFEHSIRNAILTATCESGATFIDVVKILENPGGPFLQKILPKVQDPIVKAYWTEQIAHTADFHKSEVLDYVVSKFGRFVTNKMIRNIIGQSESAFNFRKVMDEGKILLINLAKGKIGEENSSFLGLVIIPQILMAAMSRQDVPENQRRDFYLYVDEFQNFATPDFAQILSEARKYRLCLTVANQFISQMEDEVKNAVFGNVGTIVSFQTGVDDANYLARQFQPTFSEQDLQNVERYHVYIKTIINSEPVPPFSMNLTKDMSSQEQAFNSELAEKIKRLSSLKYGKSRTEVEEQIVKRTQIY